MKSLFCFSIKHTKSKTAHDIVLSEKEDGEYCITNNAFFAFCWKIQTDYGFNMQNEVNFQAKTFFHLQIKIKIFLDGSVSDMLKVFGSILWFYHGLVNVYLKLTV